MPRRMACRNRASSGLCHDAGKAVDSPRHATAKTTPSLREPSTACLPGIKVHSRRSAVQGRRHGHAHEDLEDSLAVHRAEGRAHPAHHRGQVPHLPRDGPCRRCRAGHLAEPHEGHPKRCALCRRARLRGRQDPTGVALQCRQVHRERLPPAGRRHCRLPRHCPALCNPAHHPGEHRGPEALRATRSLQEKGLKVGLVQGDVFNIKITTKYDLRIASYLLDGFRD